MRILLGPDRAMLNWLGLGALPLGKRLALSSKFNPFGLPNPHGSRIAVADSPENLGEYLKAQYKGVIILLSDDDLRAQFEACTTYRDRMSQDWLKTNGTIGVVSASLLTPATDEARQKLAAPRQALENWMTAQSLSRRRPYF